MTGTEKSQHANLIIINGHNGFSCNCIKRAGIQKEAAVNWCEECGTVLANEQVIDGKCWRCDHVVEKNIYLSGS